MSFSKKSSAAKYVPKINEVIKKIKQEHKTHDGKGDARTGDEGVPGDH